MKRIPCSSLWLLFVLGILLPGPLAASVEYDARVPQLVFAAQELRAALEESGREHLQVADNLDGYAAAALEAIPALRAGMGDNVELRETLNDIESMAYLGRYYADKMRGAAKLAVFREGDRRDNPLRPVSIPS